MGGLCGCSPRRPPIGGRSRSAQGQGRPRWRVCLCSRFMCGASPHMSFPRMLSQNAHAHLLGVAWQVAGAPKRLHSDLQLLHPEARLGAQVSARGAVSKACDLGRCERPNFAATFRAVSQLPPGVPRSWTRLPPGVPRLWRWLPLLPCVSEITYIKSKHSERGTPGGSHLH